MKKTYLVVTSIIALMVLLVLLLVVPSGLESGAQPNVLPRVGSEKALAAPVLAPSKAAATSSPLNGQPKDLSQESRPSAEARFTDAMRANIGQVAAAYERASHYPSYSTPLSSANWDLLHPQAFVKNQQPVAGDSEVTAVLNMPKFVFFHEEPIEVSVTVQAAGRLPDLLGVKIEIMDGSKVLAELSLRAVDETASSKRYFASYQPGSNERSEWNMALQMVATVELRSGGETTLVSPFKYSKKHVVLTGVERSLVRGADLVIPLKVKVYTDGRYQFRANLYTESGHPISHLSIKENLSGLKDDIAFKVHSSLLRESNAAGPYMLREFNITKVPAIPGQKTEYGISEKDQYQANGFPLDQYSNEPYIDPMNQARLNFLKQMAK